MRAHVYVCGWGIHPSMKSGVGEYERTRKDEVIKRRKNKLVASGRASARNMLRAQQGNTCHRLYRSHSLTALWQGPVGKVYSTVDTTKRVPFISDKGTDCTHAPEIT